VSECTVGHQVDDVELSYTILTPTRAFCLCVVSMQKGYENEVVDLGDASTRALVARAGEARASAERALSTLMACT
jgi:hypothetical protein